MYIRGLSPQNLVELAEAVQIAPLPDKLFWIRSCTYIINDINEYSCRSFSPCHSGHVGRYVSDWKCSHQDTEKYL